MRRIGLSSLAILCLTLIGTAAHSQNSQSYLNDVGSTAYGINIPVENGFINVSNGNLHLEFPLASHPQRGALSLNERLVYDSRIWMFLPFGSNGSYHWWPYNIPGTSTSSGGWRFVSGNEPGTITHPQLLSSSTNLCGGDSDGPSGSTQKVNTYSIAWTDPNGVIHPTTATVDIIQRACDNQDYPLPQNMNGGTATDGSGYQIQDDGNGNPLVVDNNGAQVYPQQIDRYGNMWSADGNNNLIDTTGRVPVIATQDGNTTYYDVLAPNGNINNNGTRVRYTVISASVPVATQFNQSDVYEWNPSTQYLNPVQSIQLPDGSQYSFSYDSYGGLSAVTLPSGGTVQYGYNNFVDSSNTANRWLVSRTQGNNPALTITPSVVTTCPNYSTGCVEKVNVHKPSGDETEYLLTLINGAWNTGATSYSGSASNGQKLSSNTSVNQYTNGCSNASTCSGANYLSQSTTTTVLYANGSPSVSSQTQSSLNADIGKVDKQKEWDFGADVNGNPTRETDYVYTGVDVQTVKVLSNGTMAGQTTYAYTPNAAGTSGVTQHGSQNAGGPYLQNISHWLNTNGSWLTTTYTTDDTGQVTGTTDPKGYPTVTSYQCSNSLPYQTINALNQSSRYGYDCSSGSILSVQDPNDLTAGRGGTTYAYDSAGRLQTTHFPNNGQTTYGYPSATEKDTSTLATPNPTLGSSTNLDSFGRFYQQNNGGVLSETTYDANGRISCVTNPHFSSATDGSTCITTYDGLDRPAVRTQPDGTTLNWSYNGATVVSTDEAGKSWQRTSNSFGQLMTVVEPGNLGTTYTYDGLGNLLTINQNGTSGDTPRTRSFTHDSLSRLVSETNPESGTITYTYDNNGNVRTRTDNRGVQTTYSYDALNRLTDKVFSDGSTPNQHFKYDQTSDWMGPQTNTIGRLSESYTEPDHRYYGTGSPPACVTPTSPTSNYNSANGNPTYCKWTNELYSYNELGLKVRIGTAFPSETGWSSHTMDLGYDLAGNLSNIRYPDGRGVTQTRDGAARVQSVTYDNWYGTHIGYNYLVSASNWPDGSPQLLVFGNGTSQSFLKGNRLQPTETSLTTSVNGANQKIFDRQYAYTSSCQAKNNGNIMMVNDLLNSGQTQGYCYDGLNRLASFSNGSGNMQQSYGYDSFGNLSQSGTASSVASYTAKNQVSSGVAYDAAGNINAVNNGISNFLYPFDAENRMFTSSAGDFYTYDVAGQRMRKDLGGDYTEYQYLDGQVIAEKHPDGTWSDYIYADGQKIARADDYDTYIHVHGTSSGNALVSWTIARGGGYVIKANDKLYFRQFQINGYSGMNLQLQDYQTYGTSTADTAGQLLAVDQIQNQWLNRVVDLNPFAGEKVINYQLVSDSSTPTGNYDLFFGDIAIVSSDGTVTPIYNRQQGATYSVDANGGQTNLSAAQEVSGTLGDAIQGYVTTTYYHGDQLGSVRASTAGGGWPMSSDTFYPFGQNPAPNGSPNHFQFAGLERDAETGLDHAMFRQYSSTTGRWMSPDPYDGSMDLNNPQTLNRYAYVGNMPLNFRDPSGLNPLGIIANIGLCFGGTNPGACIAEVSSGPVGWAVLGVSALLEGLDIAGVFSHPAFDGSTKPRPGNITAAVSQGPIIGQSDGTYTMSVSYSVPAAQGSPDAALGLLGGAAVPSIPTPTPSVPTRLFGTHYCGPGGAGTPVDSLDIACQAHDACYDANGLTVGSNFGFGLDHQKTMGLQACNQTLCNAAAATQDLGATRVQLYFQSVPYGFCQSVRR